jgi:hypothetical protein
MGKGSVMDLELKKFTDHTLENTAKSWIDSAENLGVPSDLTPEKRIP